ncbi:quinone-dependent dihydroorotate dehydrogenase [Penaeicola halotolerans]|uniref:quinone-dependent dihydroorotate dehydrogenase n=1 Tax=Penaeicola halotolerans TaxID=2793196 RepID=UPI001CF833F8|nr:quinone-dependent dihydroorotate dehydrogenase [Penaeicola halotolerans]
MYQSIIKPLLFRLQPEQAHHLTFRLVKFFFNLPGAKRILKSKYQFADPLLEKEVFGIKFPNPVGLAAGFDKDAVLIDEMSQLGFGFIEIGTLTPQPQIGNPQPRLFRLPEDQALINRMGFNNGGVAEAVERLKKRQSKVIIGGNIGKNKVTPNEEAVADYEHCFDALYPYVDYFVVNVSSPNTPNLRELQDKEPLKALLMAVQTRNSSKPAQKPVLLKIAPDLTNEQLDDIIEIIQETKIAGVIATNTTIARDQLSISTDKIEKIGAGGLSGKVLAKRSTDVIQYLSHKSGGSFPIIGVGGIFTAADAIEKLEAGASLVQVYTGFIYQGPSIVSDINRGLLSYIKQKQIN